MTAIYRGLLSQWVIPELPADSGSVMDIPRSIQHALYRRGVKTEEEIHRFFHPETSHLPDAGALPDLDKALNLLHEAIQRGSFIYVVGDYDVDGTTSAALIGSFLQAVGHHAFYLHLPDRFKEGYGVSDLAVSETLRMGATLFIAVDCGTKEIERLHRLRSAGVRVIVIDHHAVGETDPFPPADAFINPQRPDASYPNRYLSAAALTYRVLSAYRATYGCPETWEGVDLAAISLLADIMPLVGENRLLVQLGLEHLQRAPRPGISALIEAAGISPDMLGRSRPVVFQLVPRLNASGRLRHPRFSLYLLLAQERSGKVDEVARYLDQLNTYRQTLQKQAYQEALGMLEKQYPGILEGANPPPALVVVSAGWNKGIIGLVASKLVERFYRPAVVFNMSGGLLVGSARSPAEIPLYQVLHDCCSRFMLRFGGHDRAAGLTIRSGDMELFTQAFQEGCAAYGDLIPTGIIDAAITPAELRDGELAQWCERFEPVGPQNEAPRFLLHGLHLWRAEEGRLLFAHGVDAMYDAWLDEGGGERLRAYLRSRVGQPVSLVITPRLTGSGRTYLRLRDVVVGEAGS